MQEPRRPIIAVDIDGVYFDHTQEMLDALNERFNTDYKYSDVTSFEYDNFERKQRDFLFSLWPKMDYHKAHVEEGAEDVISVISNHYDIIAVSSPMPGLHVRTKYERLRRDFGYKNVFLCSRKYLLDADVLIDDAPHNITEWVNTGRPVIIYSRPWNHSAQEELYRDPMVFIVQHWSQIPGRIEEALGVLAQLRDIEAPTAPALSAAELQLLLDEKSLHNPAAQRAGDL